MEKTLRRLYVSTMPFTERMRAERERASRLLEIPGTLRIVNEYRQITDVLNHLELESDADIAEHSLKEHIAEPGYHTIYLLLSEDEWYDLGLRTSLYGQSRTVDGQVIGYGRPGTTDYEVLHQYDDLIWENFTESTLREWHELCHGTDDLLDLPHDNTHYHFYGYATRYENVPGKHRRWVRKPTPLTYWRSLPWQNLPDLERTYKLDLLRDALQALVAAYQLLIKRRQLVKPLREWDTARVSQPYGEYNPNLYPLTEHHIGVDHAVPKGTPIYAPAEGHIVEAGYNNVLGHYFVYEYAKDRWIAALHLASHPTPGIPFKAGEEIATVGDTGFIRGVHSHLEVWTVKPNRAQVSSTIHKGNWRTVTRDPLKAF